MIYAACTTNHLRIIHPILHNRRPARVLRRHPCEMVEFIHLHLWGYVQIHPRVEWFQASTYRRFRNHREMCRVVSIHLFTVIAQILGTIHAVEPLPSNWIHTQIAKDVHVYNVS